MANKPAQVLAKHLRNLTAAARADGLSDRELLERFTAGHDEDAFAALVRRHGPMVLRVCRHILHNGHDAEDVFQATFLVLSRKAASLRRRDSVGCFLHGVAYRLALKARAQLAQRRMHESQTAVEKYTDGPLAELRVREAQAILDEELGRLPEKYRAVLVLCCLEGRTRDEAARQLGWSARLVKSRLEQGRERLRYRLTRRGLTLPAALGATLLTEEAIPAVMPATLVRAVVQAARIGNHVSTSVALLAESALGSAITVKAKVVVGMLLLTGVLAAGVGAFVVPKPAGEQTESPAAAKTLEPPKSEKSQPARTDCYGDPLPPGALARIGTVRFRDGGWFFQLAYSPDGKTLASTTAGEETVRIWDAATGKERLLLQPHSGWIYSIAFSPDGKRFATIGEDKDQRTPVSVWDTSTGDRLQTFCPSQRGYHIAFSPDGRCLAIVARKERQPFIVGLWDLDSGKEVLQLKGQRGIIMDIVFSPDGKMLATGGSDASASLEKRIHLWDAATGKLVHRLANADHAFPRVAFSPDSKVVAGGSTDGTVRIWDAATGRERLTIPGHDKKWIHSTYGGRAPVVFSPDGKCVAAGSEGIVFDAATGKERCQLQSFHCAVRSLVYSPDGKTLAGEASHRIRFWDAATGKEIFKDQAHRAPVCSLAFTPDSKSLVTAGQDDSVGLWDAYTGRERFRFQGPVTEDIYRTEGMGSMPNGRTTWQMYRTEAAVAADGRRIAAWLGDGLYSWDLRKREAVRECSAGDGFEYYRTAVFSPQGRLLAAAWSWDDKQIRLWTEGPSKGPRLLQPRAKGFGNALAISSDGKVLACGYSGGAAGLWDVATGKELHIPGVKQTAPTKPGQASGSVYRLAFSPDSTTLALGGTDGTVVLWEMTTGKELRRFLATDHWTEALAFSPDGKTLAAGHAGGMVRFWEAATGKIRREWQAHPESIHALAFSPDGRLLASAGSDTTVLIWPTSGEQPKTTELSDKRLETLWTDLAEEDAAKAYQAIAALLAAPRQTVPFLKTHMRPAPAVDAKRLARLIADLDDEQFSVREKASAELAEYADQAEAALRKTLEGKPSLEMRRRIQAILEELNRPLSAEPLRQLRALEVLERIRTLPAQEVLRTLADGASKAQLTREAKAALERLAHRSNSAR